MSDGLVAPLNAPPAAPVTPGVQPGTTSPSLRAVVVIISGPSGAVTGIFQYAPGTTPGPGNAPVAWWSTTATKDPYGNILVTGTQFGAGGNGAWFRIGSQQLELCNTGAAQPAFAVPLETIIPPSGDTSGATDAALINAALGLGTAVRLLAGTYYVNSTIQLIAGSILRGAGRSHIGQLYNSMTTIVAASAAMKAVIATQGWLQGTNTSAIDGCQLSGFKVNGAGLGTFMEGIILQAWDCAVDNVAVENMTGDGIGWSVLDASNTVPLTGSGPNNRITNCSISNVAGSGIFTSETGSSDVFTDGYCCGNIVAGTTGTSPSIMIQQAAGWLIDGNHVYGIAGHAIQAGDCVNTRITGNYIDGPWGASATSSTWRAIDCFTFPSFGGGNVIAGNSIAMNAAPGNAASSIEGMNLACAAANTAGWSVTGNFLEMVPAAGFVTADPLVATNTAASCTSHVTSTGNNVQGHWSTAAWVQIPDGGTITLTTGV